MKSKLALLIVLIFIFFKNSTIAEAEYGFGEDEVSQEYSIEEKNSYKVIKVPTTCNIARAVNILGYNNYSKLYKVISKEFTNINEDFIKRIKEEGYKGNCSILIECSDMTDNILSLYFYIDTINSLTDIQFKAFLDNLKSTKIYNFFENRDIEIIEEIKNTCEEQKSGIKSSKDIFGWLSPDFGKGYMYYSVFESPIGILIALITLFVFVSVLITVITDLFFFTIPTLFKKDSKPKLVSYYAYRSMLKSENNNKGLFVAIFNYIKGRFISTLILLICAGYLAVGGIYGVAKLFYLF